MNGASHIGKLGHWRGVSAKNAREAASILVWT
jgi:hypothetical protein